MLKRKRSGGSDRGTIDNRPSLRIVTTFTYASPSDDNAKAPLDERDSESDSEYDSLFDEEEAISLADPMQDMFNDNNDSAWISQPAQRSPPAIPGLFLSSSVLVPTDLAEQLWINCMKTFFRNADVNQVMLFERAKSTGGSKQANSNGIGSGTPQTTYFPSFLHDLLDTLKELLKAVVPAEVHALLFPLGDKSQQARQVIINHYRPGEGIAPHVDLLNRYGDGIIGVSLHSGTVMNFTKVYSAAGPVDGYQKKSNGTHQRDLSNGSHSTLSNDSDNEPNPFPESFSVYLPEQSIFVLSGEARYNWTHGIPLRTEDLVESLDETSAELLPRGERLSITFRWLLPGADIVGD